jgi:hypothetical protein
MKLLPAAIESLFFPTGCLFLLQIPIAQKNAKIRYPYDDNL